MTPRSVPWSLLCCLLASPAAASDWIAATSDAQSPALAAVDAAVPTPAASLGYAVGARFTRHERLLAYYETLRAAAPGRLRVVDYGETAEQRPLRLLVFSSARNGERLEALRGRWRRVAQGERDALGDDLPALVWLSYGVHGNESSSAEAAAAVAYALAAGGDDIAAMLERLVVIIDPLANPDGRERYLSGFFERRGAAANPDPRAAEHVEPWPGGRENHYLFDLNRDWAWATQRESRARLAAWRAWEPQVHVDFHEMRADSATYFFPPAAEPVNPRISPSLLPWLGVFGDENGAAFDRAAWPYYVRETYDLFYPSYGDSYPSLRGAVGMTYEVAGGGGAGELARLPDGTTVALADRVAKHVTSSLATLRAAAAHRVGLLESAVERAREARSAPVATYLWPRTAEGRAIAELLVLHGARVGELERAQEIDIRRGRGGEPSRRAFPAGAYAASTAQPLGNLLRTLLDAETSMPDGFVRAQRERLIDNRPSQVYDITAWALPHAFNCEISIADGDVSGVRDATLAAGGVTGSGEMGFLIAPQGLPGWQLAVELLRRRAVLRVALEPFEHGARSYPSGTLMLLARQNAAELAAMVADLASAAGVAVERVATSASERGISLGSESTQSVRLPHIGVVRGEVVEPTAFGALWHLFDERLGLPHTVLESSSLASADLRSLDVLVLPDGDYETLGDPAGKALERWVRSGGVLVGIGGAASWAQKRELTTVKSWQPPKPLAAAEPRESLPTPEQAIADREIEVPGAALRTALVSGSLLTVGFRQPPPALFTGDTVLLPTGDPRVDLWTVAGRDEVLGGLVWPEASERLRGALLMSSESQGRGQVVLFAQDPAFRGFWQGTMPLLLNAVVYEPSRHGVAGRR